MARRSCFRGLNFHHLLPFAGVLSSDGMYQDKMVSLNILGSVLYWFYWFYLFTFIDFFFLGAVGWFPGPHEYYSANTLPLICSPSFCSGLHNEMSAPLPPPVCVGVQYQSRGLWRNRIDRMIYIKWKFIRLADTVQGG